jgi:hypothetical protein
MIARPQDWRLGMAENDNAEGEKFYHEFATQLRAIDDVANIVLQGHLLIEQDIDEAIEGYFFQPQYLLDDRTLGFERKVQLLRASTYLHPDEPDWELLLAFNSLRNEIAHKRDGPKRKAKLERVRNLILKSASESASEKYSLKSDDKEMAIFAAARCTGFLVFVSDSLISGRWYIERLLEALKEGTGFHIAPEEKG